MRTQDDKNYKKLEGALRDSYRADIDMDKTFKKNLDKLVDNTINAVKLGQKAQFLEQQQGKRRSFWKMLFASTKWQVAFLTSFIGILLFGGIAFAAVPSLREIILPTKGELYINSKPESAQVSLKGGEYGEYMQVGETPFTKEIKAGKYQLKLELEDYETYESEFDLEVGKSVNLEINLKKIYSALDRVKEWKTYTDLEHGYEFTYPLDWKLTKDDPESPNLEVSGSDSKFVINNDLDSSGAEKLIISGEDYNGWTDYEGWGYVVFELIKSNDSTNSVTVMFYSQKEGDFEIYEFIKSTIKVYDREEESEEVVNWSEFNGGEFSFKYPTDWIVIERVKSEYYAEYEVRSKEVGSDALMVRYSAGYLEEMNDFFEESQMVINGAKVTRYYSETSEGKFLYEFPNRVFVMYQSSQDSEVNEKFENIVNSFEITDGDRFQEISDYYFGYLLTLPQEWVYTHSIGEEGVFAGAEYAQAADLSSTIHIYRWKDIENVWDEYKTSLRSDHMFFRSTLVMIDNRDYVRFEIWERLQGEYSLQKVLYLVSLENDVTLNWDPRVLIGDTDFVIICETDLIVFEDPHAIGTSEEIISADEEVTRRLSLLDAIVASMIGIEG